MKLIILVATNRRLALSTLDDNPSLSITKNVEGSPNGHNLRTYENPSTHFN